VVGTRRAFSAGAIITGTSGTALAATVTVVVYVLREDPMSVSVKVVVAVTFTETDPWRPTLPTPGASVAESALEDAHDRVTEPPEDGRFVGDAVSDPVGDGGVVTVTVAVYVCRVTPIRVRVNVVVAFTEIVVEPCRATAPIPGLIVAESAFEEDHVNVTAPPVGGKDVVEAVSDPVGAARPAVVKLQVEENPF